MEKIYRVNLIYSLLLIIAGFYGFVAHYMDTGEWPVTALIPVLFGGILLPMTGSIRKSNRIIAHIAVVLTLLMGVMVTVMLIINLNSGTPFTRKMAIFLVILAASLIALGFYVASFIAARKNRASAESVE